MPRWYRPASPLVVEIDTAAALAEPGVLTVLTHHDLPRLHPVPLPPLGQPMIPLSDDRVHYKGQPVAIVLAAMPEQARQAATLVTVRYADTVAPTSFGGTQPVVPTGSFVFDTPDESHGDFDAGLAHNPLEPSATVAAWDGDQLTVHDATQWISGVQQALATAFELPIDRVRVVCPFIGGGFGCKGWTWPHQLLTAAAARVLGRPVKLVLTRAEMFTSCGHQPATRQTVWLGAHRDGRLTAVRHHSVNVTARLGDFAESATSGTRWMYASPAIAVSTRVERTEHPMPTPMRAPGEGVGMFALESAMDELAYELGIDPLELRLRNEPELDPLPGKAFSSRPLRACLVQGAERFGWRNRPPAPRSLRDGRPRRSSRPWVDSCPQASPLGAKGIGELGAVGVSAAIANAVFHATGIRVRDLPITLERLL